MLVDTALLAQDLEDCREFINLILYLLEQKNLEQDQRDRFIGLLVKNLAYDLDMYLKVLRVESSTSEDQARGLPHHDLSGSDQAEAASPTNVLAPLKGNVVSFPLESPG